MKTPLRGDTLVYLMGPSGSGKDTLLRRLPELLADALPAEVSLRIARRTITRPAQDEASESVSPEEFTRRLALGAFALHWHSHGLSYGIGVEIDRWLAQDDVVLVNGSREYLPRAHARYPGLTAVSIVVPHQTLAARLRERAREAGPALHARLARAQTLFAVPPGCRHVHINNAGDPAVAARELAEIVLGVAQPLKNSAPPTAPRQRRFGGAVVC